MLIYICDMGTLRFLLAISVVLAHTYSLYGFGFVGGQVAVESFFIISGFYITLILNEKYIRVNNSYWLFISNRFLRLFPIYWIVLILTIGCAMLLPLFDQDAFGGGLSSYREYGHNLSFSTWIYIGFTNLLVFFQESSLYFGLNTVTGKLFYVHNFALNNPQVWKFNPVPQAWSIGIELLFYVVAPFVVRKKWTFILPLLIISLFLKVYAMHHGFGDDPWSYRFFPFELMYFLLGTLSYIIYREIVRKKHIPKSVNIALLSIIIILTIVYTRIQFRYIYEVYMLLVFLFIPVLFKYTKSFKIDRFIGELSYPIYITHVLVLNTLRGMGVGFHLNLLTIGCSILLSVILIKAIGDRIERARQSRVLPGSGIHKNADALSVQL